MAARPRAAIAIAALALASGTVTGCYNNLTEPQSTGLLKPPTAQRILTYDSTKLSPNSGTWTTNVDPWDGSTPLGNAWNFALPTIVIINVAGIVDQGDGAIPGNHYKWGPTGDPVTHSGAIGYRLASATGAAMQWPRTATDTVVVQK
jgi:hypothetical protein